MKVSEILKSIVTVVQGYFCLLVAGLSKFMGEIKIFIEDINNATSRYANRNPISWYGWDPENSFASPSKTEKRCNLEIEKLIKKEYVTKDNLKSLCAQFCNSKLRIWIKEYYAIVELEDGKTVEYRKLTQSLYKRINPLKLD